MTDIDALAYRVGDRLRAMEASNVAPYDKEPFDLSRGEAAIILKALQLLEVIRHATK